MCRFAVRINPTMPSFSRSSSCDVSQFDYDEVTKSAPELYDLHYIIDGNLISYYPSHILSVLNDVNEEVNLFNDGTSHYMTISGYTVLYADISAGLANFYDPVSMDGSRYGTLIGEAINVSEIAVVFRNKSASICEFIKAALRRSAE